MAKPTANKGRHKGANQGANRGGRKSPRRTTLLVGVVAIALLLTGGVFVALQGDRVAPHGAQAAAAQTDATQVGTAQTAAATESFYAEVSIQRIADTIEHSEHALIYFRSPT